MLEDELSRQDKEELKEYRESIKNCKILSYTELDELLHNLTLQNKQKFIEGSLMMVVNYATRLYIELKKDFVFPYSILDFIQLGNESLIKFVYEEKHDNYKSFIWAYSIAIKRNVIKNLLPISWHVVDKYLEFLEKRDEFLKLYQHDASSIEMINKYGYSKRKFNYLNNCRYQNQSSVKSLKSEVVIKTTDYIPELVEYLIVKETILEIVENLDLKERYREILVKYFGLTTKNHAGNNVVSGFVDLSKEYNVTGQRIQQILNASLRKIKCNDEAMEKLKLCKEIIF